MAEYDSKTDFIRQHSELTSLELIELAGKSGVHLSMRHIQKVRYMERRAANPERVVPRKNVGQPGVNKAAWIRKRLHLGNSEIVARAKKAGIQITANYVSVIRYYAK